MQKNSRFFLSFFLVSLFSVAAETFLTRYFAVTNWSEYGYWIISIVMAGFSVSGVLMALFEKFFEKHADFLISVIPALLIVFITAGFFWTSAIPFNPLEFQNEVTWTTQLGFIFQYYAALFPIFFLLGLYIGLNYILFSSRISEVYALNLIGSALGSIVILILMFFVNPLYLLAAVFPILLLAGVLSVKNQSKKTTGILITVSVVLFLASEILMVGFNQSKFPFYKEIFSKLQVEKNKVVAKIFSPSGYYMILDNITEFDGVDLSNNYGNLKMSAPPRSYGIYRDGRRISSLMKDAPKNFTYLKGALDSFPFMVRTNADVLLLGVNGGYRILERKEFKPNTLTALESDAECFSLVNEYSKKAGVNLTDGKDIQFLRQSPFSYLDNGRQKFDIIEISSEYLSLNENNKYGLTSDAVSLYLKNLKQNGIVSIPVNITEFTVYAIKMLHTIKAALIQSGVQNPEKHILIVRSNWTARFFVSRDAFSETDIKAMRNYANQCSFDTSYFPGIEPDKINVWNDLPAISFEDESFASSDKASDAIMQDAVRILANQPEQTQSFFNLRPSTVDRPSFFSILNLSKFGKIFEKRSILPQEEIGYLINVFILMQAVILALIILILPLFKFTKESVKPLFIGKMAIYFGSLGLGFLFIEMALIERFSYYLNDATSSFSIVLAGMLIFSGLGSWFSSKFTAKPFNGVKIAVLIIAVSVLFYIFGLFPLINATMALPFAVKSIVITLVIAPVSFALGMPFPMGLTSLQKQTKGLLPWAWAINGAFSVISTPLANIFSVSMGFTFLFAIGLILYLTAFAFFPVKKAL